MRSLWRRGWDSNNVSRVTDKLEYKFELGRRRCVCPRLAQVADEIGAPTRATEQENRGRGKVDPRVAARLGTDCIGYRSAADHDSAST